MGLLGTAYALLRGTGRTRRLRVPRYGWPTLAVLGGAALLVGPLDALNPLRTGAPVGPWPVLDVLLVAYAVPALLCLAVAREAERPAARVAAAAGHLLAFVWLTLEVRHWFQGPSLRGPTGRPSGSLDSAAWLAWAALLLGLGVRLDRRPLRVAALAIAAVAIAKAFLFDLADSAASTGPPRSWRWACAWSGWGGSTAASSARRRARPAEARADIDAQEREGGAVEELLERELVALARPLVVLDLRQVRPATWRWWLARALQGSSRTVTA